MPKMFDNWHVMFAPRQKQFLPSAYYLVIT